MAGPSYATEFGPGDLVRVNPDDHSVTHLLQGKLNVPGGLAVDGEGDVYISFPPPPPPWGRVPNCYTSDLDVCPGSGYTHHDLGQVLLPGVV